jgi:hypothetical protein
LRQARQHGATGAIGECAEHCVQALGDMLVSDG